MRMGAELDGDPERVEWGLRRYVQQVAHGLGVGLEAACCEAGGRPNAYLALDARLPGYPGRDVALFWDARHGWAIGVETASGEDVLVVSYLAGGEVLADPETVVVFAKTVLAGHQPEPQAAPTVQDGDLQVRLADYARPTMITNETRRPEK